MVTTWGEYYYAWNGRLYQSDMIRSCMRPYVQAVGKLVAKHIRDDAKNGLQVNPRVSIAMLLKYPNAIMTAQQFQEKMAAQLLLNNNAFALVVRDENGMPCGLYPIPCVNAEAVYGTRPWRVFGEGETRVRIEGFREDKTDWTRSDFRFTQKDYLEEPKGKTEMPSMR